MAPNGNRPADSSPMALLPTAVSDADFARLMAAFHPFEARTSVAVAVSGGGDSMALCLLADRWARQRGGRVLALTVDHGLRPQSAAEAACVGGWLAARGIAHAVLTWQGDKPGNGIQAAARAARYALLEAWCREAGILHLLLGHSREDQMETVLLRLGRATGIEGAAGMSAVVEKSHVRLLRPCLGVPRQRLRAVLTAKGQAWVEDPSNNDLRFARVRVRGVLDRLDDDGRAALWRAIRGFGRARLMLEAATAAALAEGCRLHPAGYAVVDAACWRHLPERLAVAVLTRLCTTIGGSLVPPRDSALRDVATALRGAHWRISATLAGCRLIVGDDGLLVCREARHLPAPLMLSPGLSARWDGRFQVAVGADALPGGALRLDYLGPTGWAEVAARAPDLRRSVPAAARAVLPALWDDHGVLQVPHLAYNRLTGSDGLSGSPHHALWCGLLFAPAQSLSGNGFQLAPELEDTI